MNRVIVIGKRRTSKHDGDYMPIWLEGDLKQWGWDIWNEEHLELLIALPKRSTPSRLTPYTKDIYFEWVRPRKIATEYLKRMMWEFYWGATGKHRKHRLHKPTTSGSVVNYKWWDRSYRLPDFVNGHYLLHEKPPKQPTKLVADFLKEDRLTRGYKIKGTVPHTHEYQRTHRWTTYITHPIDSSKNTAAFDECISSHTKIPSMLELFDEMSLD